MTGGLSMEGMTLEQNCILGHFSCFFLANRDANSKKTGLGSSSVYIL